MGYKWRVAAWLQLSGDTQYAYHTLYQGDWLIVAVWWALGARYRDKAGCVRVEWRGWR